MLIYRLGIILYSVAVKITSIWNIKASAWINGRKKSFEILNQFNATKKKNLPLYWFHCASLGEFEQARPLIEKLKEIESCQIAISFFSPSGYEIRKNYDLADVIFYLPVDSKKNAKNVISLLKPNAIFFIKYEFWISYIDEAFNQNIPFYSVCAVFRKNQLFFKWYGKSLLNSIKRITKIYVQNNESEKLLETFKINTIVAGDTRYDRVMSNAKQAKKFELIDLFVDNKKVFVCGSLWNPDFEAIHEGLKKLDDDWKIILTTHEIDETHLQEAESFFRGQNIVRYSKLNSTNADYKILLIDNVGMLMHLYGYGQIAYVGGAFKTGLHNILEPASFGLNVIFGPKHEKFPEANYFIKNGVGFSISNKEEFKSVLYKLMKENNSEKIKSFMHSNCGATEKILSSTLK